MIGKVNEVIGSARASGVLLALHVLILAGAFLLDHPPAPDEATYVGLAKGLEKGVFSCWTEVFDPAPIDVHRTHGYPVFLVLLRALSTDLQLVFVVQALFHVITLLLVMRMIGKGDVEGHYRRNLFLLLMLPQFQLVYYVYQVFPETLMAMVCTWMGLAGTTQRPGSARSIVLAVLGAVAFWVRPVMLLFPLFVLLLDSLVVRKAKRLQHLKSNVAVLAMFLLLGPLPFALWNLRVHGVFKPVPLTGSGLLTNLGFWQLRLPGYGTMHYFQYNYFGREIVPLVNEEEAVRYYAEYQAQWARIDSASRGAMTRQDSLYIPRMADHRDELYVTRSPEYTVALDKAISRENRAMLLNDPGYYLGTRFYAAIRLWVTNINLPMTKIVYEPKPGVVPIVGRPSGLKGWLATLVPFGLTVVTFGIGIPWLIWNIYRNRQRWYERRYVLYLIAYVWMIHVPMSIQSRYTVPLHALAIACIALAIADRERSAIDQGSADG